MSNAYDVVQLFEGRVAAFCGASYGVAVDSCTNALYLSLRFIGVRGMTISVPRRTYCSVPMQVIHAGGKVVFDDREWSGVYRLNPLSIIDGAKRFRRGCYEPRTFHCLSFHIRKHLPIGRGGMILTDDADAARWFRMARRDGRDDIGGTGWQAQMLGFNCYMPPSDAARGLALLDVLPSDQMPDQVETYDDLSTWTVFQGCSRA